MKSFLIYTNRHKDVGMTTTNRIRDYLLQKGQRVYLKCEDEYWEACGIENRSRSRDIPEDADCMLVLGGDGTVLQAVRDAGRRSVPIIGINLGTLGYLTEIETDSLEDSLDKLIEGEYEQESRMMLNGKAYLSNGELDEGWALNDIVITRKGPLKIIKFHIYVNGQFLNAYDADGMIVTTPTGSTGYNLSAGGPLVEPRAKVMVLTPICPHSLNQRSIILSPDDLVEIEIPEGREGSVQTVEASFDGSHFIALNTGDRIKIMKSEKVTDFIRLNQVSFLEVLHKKMSN